MLPYRLGFVEVNYVAAFEEYELQFVVPKQPNNGSEVLLGTLTSSEVECSANNLKLVLERAQQAVYATYSDN